MQCISSGAQVERSPFRRSQFSPKRALWLALTCTQINMSLFLLLQYLDDLASRITATTPGMGEPSYNKYVFVDMSSLTADRVELVDITYSHQPKLSRNRRTSQQERLLQPLKHTHDISFLRERRR